MLLVFAIEVGVCAGVDVEEPVSYVLIETVGMCDLISGSAALPLSLSLSLSAVAVVAVAAVDGVFAGIFTNAGCCCVVFAAACSNKH